MLCSARRIATAIAAAVALIGGWEIGREALESLLHRHPVAAAIVHVGSELLFILKSAKTRATISLVKHLAFAVLIALASRAESQTSSLLMDQAAGTSVNPRAEPMSMIMFNRGGWSLAVHGIAFASNANDSGRRGGSKFFSTNWGMVSAQHSLAGGVLMLRTMLSLEPATIPGRKYPELFQTGETAFGKQLIDAQHPHNFFMELAAEYARPIGRGAVAYLYVAPAGDPALGPTAFMHRASGTEIPQAPIGHHFEDSTHVAFNVITVGVSAGPAIVEASAFHGGEPDERRWIIEGGRIDSWAARLQLRPVKWLAMQFSHGHLTKPEKIEPGFAKRTTASVSSSVPFRFGEWNTTLVFGQVYKEVHDRTLNAWLGETLFSFLDRNHVTARVEIVDKDELFPHPILTVVPKPPLPIRVFRVQSYTAGYTVDVLKNAWTTTGIGANVTRYVFPRILSGFYSPHPHSVLVFARIRFGSAMSMPM